MLKYILIGLGILLVLGFLAVSAWKTLFLKLAHYKKSKELLTELHDSDTAEKLLSIKQEQKKVILRCLILTVVLIGLGVLYAGIAKGSFLKNHQHKYIASVIKEATCTEEGTQSLQCRYCTAQYEEQTPIIEHEFIEERREEATCTKRGQIIYQCSMCKKNKNEAIELLEHVFEKSDYREPTCRIAGQQVYTCKLCGASKAESIPLIDHTYTEVSRVDANCTTTGTVVYSCSSCDAIYDELLPVNDVHSYKTFSYLDAAFFSFGRNNNICEHCGEQYYSVRMKKSDGIALLAISLLIAAIVLLFSVLNNYPTWAERIRHAKFWISSFLLVLAVSALWLHFIVVNDDLKGEQWYDRLFVSENSSECDYVVSETTVSTCTENGKVSYVCSVCDRGYEELRPLKEHSFAQKGQIPPTCTERGETTFTCRACGKTYTDYTERIPHSYKETVKEATCTLHGMRTYTCMVCKDTYEEKIPPLGHSWGEWLDSTDGTGRQRSCSVCGEVQTGE